MTQLESVVYEAFRDVTLSQPDGDQLRMSIEVLFSTREIDWVRVEEVPDKEQ